MGIKEQKTREILRFVNHRPWELPKGNWAYYQEWNEAVFLHIKVPYEALRPCVPERLTIDRFEGDCYVSVVAFTMERIQTKYLPALSFISDFHEINVRTYVTLGNKKGVYFLSIEAQKRLSAWISKLM